METKDIRRINLVELLKNYDSKQAFADSVDMAPAHVSQIISEYRSMGSIIARRIEEKAGLPAGYMDVNHSQLTFGVNEERPLAYTPDPESLSEEKAFEFVDEFQHQLDIKLTPKDKMELFRRMKERYLRQLEEGQGVPNTENKMKAEVIDFLDISKQMKNR